MKDKDTKKRAILLSGIVVIAFIIGILAYFRISISNSAWNQLVSQSEEITAQKAEVINTVLKNDNREMRSFAEFANVAFRNFDDEFDAFEAVTNVGMTMTADRLLYFRNDGRIYSQRASIIDSVDERLSSLLEAGKSTVTLPFFDEELGEEVVLFFVFNENDAADTANDEIDGNFSGIRAVAGYYITSEIYGACNFTDIEGSDFFIIDPNANVVFSPYFLEDTLTQVLANYESDEEKVYEINQSIRTNESGSFTLGSSINSAKAIITLNSIDSDLSAFAVNVIPEAKISSQTLTVIDQSLYAEVILLICFIILFIYLNVSVRKYEKELELARNYDNIAKCPNQMLFEKQMMAILEERPGTKYAVIYHSVHNHKLIERVFGQKTSDAVTEELSKLVSKTRERTETYGRLNDGGIAILAAYKGEDELVERFKGVAEQIAVFTQPEGDRISVKLTAGIYCLDRTKKYQPTAIIDSVLFAEQSVQYDKGHTYAFFTQKEQDMMFESMIMEQEIEKALDNGEFHVYYQPKYNLNYDRIDSAEALVRWIKPDVGVIGPDLFIPLCERTGFASVLDRYVFEQVCKMLQQRQRDGLRLLPISVNISRAVLQMPGFAETYVAIKNKYEIKDNFIELEFTESIAFEDYMSLENVIETLHENGFLCSVDDFGSGFSSFKALKAMRFDFIKLDKFFLQGLRTDKRAEYMITGLISLAKHLEMEVIMEGVEYVEELELLKRMKCDIIQGFLYARPMKRTDFIEFIDKAFANNGRAIF